MFSKKKTAGIGQTKLATLIAHDVHLTGDIAFSNGLRMDGHVTGNVTGREGEQTLLVLSDQGSITGNVEAYDIVVNGTITGDVSVEHFVELQSNARVLGNIRYQQLRMDVGAAVEGKLTKRDGMGTPGAVSADTPAAPAPAAAAAAAVAAGSDHPGQQARHAWESAIATDAEVDPPLEHTTHPTHATH